MILNLKDLIVKYNKKTILENINLSFKNGEISCILGANGVGKSTLLKAILCIIKSSGEIWYGDTNIKKCNISQRAKYLSYVPQSININFSVSVMEYLSMNTKEDISQIIKDFELDKFIMKDMATLSGGERQKVMIARAITQNANIIILDEPTNNLDIKYQKKILEIIKKLTRDKNLIVIMTLHDLPLANKYCDNFIFLDNKKVYKCGKDILTKENIEKIYETQVEIMEYNGENKILIV